MTDRPYLAPATGFLIGLLVGLALAAPFLGVIQGSEKLWAFFGAGLAILGTIFAAWLQIKHQKMLATEERGRRFRAARAMATLDLGEVYEYVEEAAKVIAPAFGEFATLADHRTPTSPPQPPKEAASRIRELIELADQDVADQFADLLGTLQVLVARLQSFCRSTENPPAEARTSLQSVVELQLRLDRALQYARGEEIKPPPFTENETRNALSILGLSSIFPEDRSGLPEPEVEYLVRLMAGLRKVSREELARAGWL